jgi:hypothetical protein
VEKPSREILLFAWIFGGAAVAVGAILIAGILLSIIIPL